MYLNGQEVFEHSEDSTGLLASHLWLTPFSVPLAGVALHGTDLLAVRVYNRGGMGGVWKPVHLILCDQALTSEQLDALFHLHKKGELNVLRQTS